jgi:hypothetical protein
VGIRRAAKKSSDVLHASSISAEDMFTSVVSEISAWAGKFIAQTSLPIEAGRQAIVV